MRSIFTQWRWDKKQGWFFFLNHRTLIKVQISLFSSNLYICARFIQLYNNKQKKVFFFSNINFNLKKLGFPLFFINKETINSLKLRIYNVFLKKTIKKKYYPVVILEIPENLKTINKKNTLKNKRVEKRNATNKAVPNLILHEDEFIKKIKNMEIKSDSESESESGAEDNSFDVDNYDSDEIEQYDESGGLSD
jgi:hypothetical protein